MATYGVSTQPRSELPRLNSTADRYHAYHPSRPALSSDGRSYLLARNEAPFRPLPSVVRAITGAATDVNRYPDPACAELVSELARHFDVPADHIAVGAGSVTLIQTLFAAIAEPGANVVYAWRSFEFYARLADLAGVRSVQVPLLAGQHDLGAMAAAVDARTRLVMICNPNNPTGTVVSQEALVRFLDSVPQTCLVVLDEAYCEYAWPHPSPGARLFRTHPNLIVLRTFSKAYGLAGLRVGYMFADPYFVSRVASLCLPFGVTHVAQAAAAASLRADHELSARVQCTVAERARVRTALLAQGFEIPPSEANFIWLPLGRKTLAFTTACAEAGVSVQPYPDEGVRVTIGTAEDSNAFLAAVECWLSRTACSTS